ncbi:MAG: glycosyltransferase, partial [Planctomycetes bacterium]|nr:glycosyltransferase [Planctomycetota bacterium]
MPMHPWLAGASLACALLPLAMTLINLRLYRRQSPPAEPLDASETVAVCIPARNEEANIEACVESVAAQRGVVAQALVYDDQSTDGTPDLLRRMQARGLPLRVVGTEALPEGWNGKQWGCDRMGRAADARWLLFTDADVRLEPGAVAAAVDFARRSGSDLVSTVPQEICGTLGEGLVVPLIHFVLLGYLPMGFMRRDPRASLAAGCGQFLLVQRQAWLRSGGHAAFRDSMHDGIRLPRSVRQSGGRTDLFDGTSLVRCRMYRGFRQTWRGFAKNAYEGLGHPGVLAFFTVVHLMGHVLPWGLLALWSVGLIRWEPAALAMAALVAGLLTRVLLCVRFRHPWWTVPLHPLSLITLTAIQWWSLWLQ